MTARQGKWIRKAMGIALLGAAGAGAQMSWQTTHTEIGGYNQGACELMGAALRVRVHPAWLDVEEDLEIAPVGAVNTGNDGNTLEMTGIFALPQGAAITGALLWDGDRILQGRLLDKAKADSLYDSLVDRNSLPPPRPRDPILLDLISSGTYRFRIYPSVLSRSRHLRLRYQLPPVIGAEGLEMSLKAAVASLFPGSTLSIPVSFEGAGTDQILLALSDGSRTAMELPRTRLMKAADLAGSGWNPYSWYNVPGARLIPVDHSRQVAVRTSIGSGLMKGHYLNLYAGVTDEVLGGLGRRVEVVILWKWHNPGLWAQENRNGFVDYSSAYLAQSQAASLLGLYSQMGGPGNKVGLLHDDGKGAPKQFHVASREEGEYAEAMDYLRSLQGNYALDFANGMKLGAKPVPGNLKEAVASSLEGFYKNLKLVKTLYSPATGVVRHLLLVSAGPDNVTEETEGNAFFDSLFADEPLSVGTLNGSAFAQAGFDAWTARNAHPIQGAQIQTTYGTFPGLDALSLNLVVRNAGKAYDFPIKCTGGLSLSCGTLSFHGKSDQPWQDSLEWEAYDASGKRIGAMKSLPALIGEDEDTSIAVLWAGSDSPFSENRNELPLGPVYGFVDRWASLIGVPKDTLSGPEAYADTGVPRVAPAEIAEVLPNYESDAAPNGPSTALMTAGNGLENPTLWTLEKKGGDLFLRIPGLGAGLAARLELYDMGGRRVGTFDARSETGAFRLDVRGMRPGLYIVKVIAAGRRAAKRILL